MPPFIQLPPPTPNSTRTSLPPCPTAHSHPHTNLYQAAVEDGLVHVDLALPDFKIAFFLEGAAGQPGSGGGAGGQGGRGGSPSSLDPEGVVLSGWVALGGIIECVQGVGRGGGGGGARKGQWVGGWGCGE